MSSPQKIFPSQRHSPFSTQKMEEYGFLQFLKIETTDLEHTGLYGTFCF